MTRKISFGQGVHKLNIFDLVGNKLSKNRFIKIMPKNNAIFVDLGCGYDAKLTQSVRTKFNKSILLDVAINKNLSKKNYLIIGDIHKSISRLKNTKIDFCIANNILEHLEDPVSIMDSIRKIMNKNGVIYICVPNWFGKYFLELGAFKLKMLPFDEMDDHKNYFSKNELWQLLIKAGFKPSTVKIKTIKFGICTEAVISFKNY